MRIKPFWRWYDLWFGLYIDRVDRKLYLCCFTFGVEVQLNRRPKPHVISQIEAVGPNRVVERREFIGVDKAAGRDRTVITVIHPDNVNIRYGYRRVVPTPRFEVTEVASDNARHVARLLRDLLSPPERKPFWKRFFYSPLIDLRPDAKLISDYNEKRELVFTWEGGDRLEITLECLSTLQEPIDWQSGRFNLGPFSLLIVWKEEWFTHESVVVMRDGVKARLMRLTLELWQELRQCVKDFEKRALGEEWRREHEGESLPLTSKLSRLVRMR